MKTSNLTEMTKGWFVGNFNPSLIKTNDVEVAVKKYKSGDYEESHYHKIATEITVVVEGLIKMNGIVYKKDDIIIIEPNNKTDFLALEDTICTVVKYPGASNDKFMD